MAEVSALATRIVQIGPRSYLREAITPDETVVSSEPVTRSEAESSGSLITPPDGYLEREQALTTRRALLRLLTASPNTVVKRDDVCLELGREVTSQTIAGAVRRLRRDMAVIGLPAGGYMYIVPVPATGAGCCATCAAHAYLGCRRLGCRPVESREWCGAWRRL